MPLNIVFLKPQNWSRLKPYYYSTITAVKGVVLIRGCFPKSHLVVFVVPCTNGLYIVFRRWLFSTVHLVVFVVSVGLDKQHPF